MGAPQVRALSAVIGPTSGRLCLRAPACKARPVRWLEE
jgi:hypothetical protein